MNLKLTILAGICVFAFSLNLSAQTSDTFPTQLNVYGKGIFTSTSVDTAKDVLVVRPGILESRYDNLNRVYLGMYNGMHSKYGLLKINKISGDSTQKLGILGADTSNSTGLLKLYGNGVPLVKAGSMPGGGFFDRMGSVSLMDTIGLTRCRLGINAFQNGFLNLLGANNSINIQLSQGAGVNYGGIYITDHTGNSMSYLGAGPTGGGLHLANSSNINRILALVFATGHGEIGNFGSNGTRNCVMGYSEGDFSKGAFSIYDKSNAEVAGIYIDSVGNGVVWGDIKNFAADHPLDENKQIWYASLEGPEAAMYARGTGNLKDGKVFIEYPEHFRLMASEGSATIILTPLFSDTYGLCVTEKNLTGFMVEELKNGQGSFQFDWEVKAVRKGYEKYKVIRNKTETLGNSEFMSKQGIEKIKSDQIK